MKKCLDVLKTVVTSALNVCQGAPPMSSEEVSQRNHGTWSLPGKKRANRPEKSPSPADPDPFLPSRVGQSSLFARRVQVKLNCACEWGSIFRPFEADVGRCKWEEVKFHSLECTIFDV